MVEQFILSTGNPHKVMEIRELLNGFDLIARPAEFPDVEETGETLEDNARLKAIALVKATGKAAIADDTGLFVDALHGGPGVRSARFAGEHASYADNINKLLAVMADVPIGQRRAHFATVGLVCFPDGREVVAYGRVDGIITTEARGPQAMGYDPVFVADEGGGATFAEMGLAAKQEISHRGRAFRALIDQFNA